METIDSIREILAGTVAEKARNLSFRQENASPEFVVYYTWREENTFDMGPVVAFHRKGDAALLVNATAIMDALIRALDSGDAWEGLCTIWEVEKFWHASTVWQGGESDGWSIQYHDAGYRFLAVRKMGGRMDAISDGFYIGGERLEYVAKAPDRIRFLMDQVSRLPGFYR